MQVPENWTFKNKEVATHFEEHVREQLPWYDLVTNAIAHLGRHYIAPRSLVYDIGASTGNVTRALQETCAQRAARIVAIEESKEMCEQFVGDAELIKKPAENYAFEGYSFGVLNLTLQFVQPRERAKLIETLQSKLEPGGALVLVDKFEPEAGYASTVMYRLTLAGKLANGATPEAIIQKELSLSGVQRPLKREDFVDWREFFRFGDFAGFIYER